MEEIMAIDDKQVKEFEDKFKSVLFEKVEEMFSTQHELISKIHEIGNYGDLESDLPNLRYYIKQ